MAAMNALVKEGPTLTVRRVPVPDLAGPADVRVRVALAGLCRTDVQVAAGELAAADPLILGHEFAGVVDRVGDAVAHVRPGQRVAVQPVLGCGSCPLCRAADEINCPRRTMLGLDRDGAFAEYVVVPGRLVVPLPDGVSLHAAAYAEPVAAALGVLTADLPPDQPGLVLGRTRFAVLVERLLRGHRFHQITLCDPASGDAEPEDSAFAFVIETGLARDTLPRMLRAVRPRGTLVLKSRQPGTVPLDVRAALLKQVTLRAVNYGPFRRAVGLLAEGALDLDGLLGPVYPLEDFARVFALARRSEAAKLFFDPSGDHVRHRR
jgi:threonine dehydrogenase-like Zn-dependent dehydrogenase